MEAKRILILILLVSALALRSYADVPYVMNFQGKATDKEGVPLNDTYDLTFRIYNHATAGDLKWTETRPDVLISNGIFEVLLGSVTPLDLPFDEDYWISVEVNADGEMIPRTRLASVGYAYKAREATNAEYVSIISIPFYRQGLELEYVDPQHIRITPGVVDVDGRILTSRDYSLIIDIQDDSNYLEDCSNPNPWIYVYVHNNKDEIGYILADRAPDKGDYQGSESGIARYYIQSDKPYRCIGALRTDSGGKAGKLLNFFQRGNLVMWDVPITITEAVSENTWSEPLSCSVAIPSTSTTGIFALYANDYDKGDMCVSIRPSGSEWKISVVNGVGIQNQVAAGPVGQRLCRTDSSQRIQYRNNIDDDATRIDVEGYILDIL